MYKIIVTDVETGKEIEKLFTGDSYAILFNEVNKTGVGLAAHCSAVELDLFATAIASNAVKAKHNCADNADDADNADKEIEEMISALNDVVDLLGGKAKIGMMKLPFNNKVEMEALIAKLKKRG